MMLAFNRRSIAFHLIAAVLAVELLSSLAVIFISLGYERHIHFAAFEVAIRGRADSVLGAVQDAEDGNDNIMLNRADIHVPPDDVYEALDGGGRLLGRSANWQGLGPNPGIPPGSFKQTHHGAYYRALINGRSYLVVRIDAQRIVDPGQPGGGTLRPVVIAYGASTDRVWRAIRGAVEFYAAGAILLLLVTGPLIAWLLHRGLVPVRQLAALAANVSADSWEFSPPPSARNTPELAPLTHAIESVLTRLERSFSQQRTFISDAAHELKTAVAVTKSSMQLLAMKHRTPAEYQAGLERCLADSQRLEEIVAKMLTLARIESAPVAAGPPPATELELALRLAFAELESVASLRKVRLAATVPPQQAIIVPIAADDCGLLLSNLLLNAIQHSPPETRIDARVTLAASTVKLVIADQGEGIRPDVLPFVFDRFYRGDPSRTRSTGGTGLGLAIVKAIVDRAKGAISIVSQPAQGTTVTIELPQMPPAPSPR